MIGEVEREYNYNIHVTQDQTTKRDTWKQTCRPIIGIYGAFLEWDIKGHLLAATRRDANNRIILIAWMVVELENDDNWEWFVRQFVVALDIQDGRNVAIISHKQSVILVYNYDYFVTF